MSFPLLPFEKSFRDWLTREGMRWEEHRIELEGGGSCRAVRLHPAGRAKRVVLAVHGAGNDALFGWVRLFKELLSAGSAIHTFDLPGHGRAGDTLFDLARGETSLRLAVTSCSVESDGLPVHAVGVSLGGSLLLHALGRDTVPITSAAAIVAPLQIRLSVGSFLQEISPRALGLIWREREHYGLTGLIPSFGPFKREIYPLRLAASPPPGAFGYVRSLNDALGEMRLEEAASAVRVPVLLAYGESDRVVPMEQGERLDRVLPSSELLRVSRGTHLSTPMATEVRSRLLEWMLRWE